MSDEERILLRQLVPKADRLHERMALDVDNLPLSVFEAWKAVGDLLDRLDPVDFIRNTGEKRE